MSAAHRITISIVSILAFSASGAAAGEVIPPDTAVAVIGVQGGGARAGQGDETWSRVFKTGPQGALELWNLSGDVRVIAGKGDEIRVDATKRLHGGGTGDLRQVEIVADESAGRVRIRTTYPKSNNVAVEVEFRVQVPAGTAVTLQTISGDIEVDKVVGETQVESVSGDVVVRGARRLARAKTVSGDVSLTDAAGDVLEANSVSGDVVLQGLKAKGCTFQTVSGSVTAQESACERAEMKSVSGEIEYAGRLSPGGRYEFKSHSGDVRLTLGGAGFSITASTFSGDLSSQLSLTNVVEQERPRHGPRTQRLQGTFGDGSAQVMVTTFSGSVVLAGK
jgi:DUF4097 and DUF4098 domain-containing protein YvlB